MLAREVERATVLMDQTPVGTLSRTKRGAVFEYAEAFLESEAATSGGLAVHLPFAQKRFEIQGDNLHPFFAGLLPEGLRLERLVRSLKTSKDDLFSLLIAAGRDVVGDASIAVEGKETHSTPRSRLPRLEDVSFAALFEESLSTSEQSLDVSIPGVQEKISGSMISFPTQVASRRAAYILKLNPPNRLKLVENEHFFMQMAARCGVEAAKTELIRDRDGLPGLLVERFDRSWSKREKRVVPVRQEDACQFLDRYPADKYRVSCRDIVEGLQVCSAPVPETVRWIRQLAFSYLIANGDLHAKNVSVRAVGMRTNLSLSPAYDVLSTLPYGDRKMALKLEGRDDDFKPRDFVALGKRQGVREEVVRSLLQKLVEDVEPFIDLFDEIGLDARRTADLKKVCAKRCRELDGA